VTSRLTSVGAPIRTDLKHCSGNRIVPTRTRLCANGIATNEQAGIEFRRYATGSSAHADGSDILRGVSNEPTIDSTTREAIRIRADDPRYAAVVDRQFNKRFRARPDYVRVVHSTAQATAAVQDAIDEGRRLVVTSGGHCLEGFVSDPDVRVLIDISPMKRIYYDAERRAIAVEAGATVGETFKALFENWGTLIPLGEYPAIGMGGHVVGGAFAFLCRQFGLAADYLYAVEVVTVDESGRANSVIATRDGAVPPGGVCVKVKDALLKKRLTDRQIDVAYDYLTRADHDVMGGMLGLATYGGRVNTVSPDATASAHRNAIFDMACTSGWRDPREEAANLAWVRVFYRDVFAQTGGVPAPGDACDGALINHPDTDLADPTLNTSGVAWQTIYYQANYSRLQRVKAQWDPRNVFHHALSVR